MSLTRYLFFRNPIRAIKTRNRWPQTPVQRHSARKIYFFGGRRKRLSKAEAFNELAEILERHINERVEKSDHAIQIFSYQTIALDLDIPVPEVENVLYGIERGGDGLTVTKGRVSSVDPRHR